MIGYELNGGVDLNQMRTGYASLTGENITKTLSADKFRTAYPRL